MANPAAPAPTPVTAQLRQARRDMHAAQSGYDAAMNLLTKAQQAVKDAMVTADQALSAKIAAQQNLETLFQSFKSTTDDS